MCYAFHLGEFTLVSGWPGILQNPVLFILRMDLYLRRDLRTPSSWDRICIGQDSNLLIYSENSTDCIFGWCSHLTPYCKSWLYISLSNSMVSDIILIAWNWLWWEQKSVNYKSQYPPPSRMLNIYHYTTDAISVSLGELCGRPSQLLKCGLGRGT